MRQLVGLSCARCQGRIPSELDGRFCNACGCPVHITCANTAVTADDVPRCTGCGAAAETREREQALHQQYEDRRPDATGWRSPRVFIAGMVGSAIMTVSACNATLNPRPDGRLLNTIPALGFDIFFPLGLAGIGYCLFRLARGR